MKMNCNDLKNFLLTDQEFQSRNREFFQCLSSTMNYHPTIDYASHPKVKIGAMTYLFSYCGAEKQENEDLVMCCTGGKITLQLLQDPPERVRGIFTGSTSDSKDFLINIQNDNSVFQMTSLGAKIIRGRKFRPTFKVRGKI